MMTREEKKAAAVVGSWTWKGRGTYTMVTFADGRVVRFLSRLSKREALRQAAP
jgi:hypothetical protein